MTGRPAEHGDARLIECAGVLFDCDGVLVDSDDSVLSAWSRWAEERSLDPSMVTDLVHGRRSADTVALLVEPDERADALARIDRFEIEDAADVRAIPGALDLVRSIPVTQWAVVTSGRRALATARLRAAGLPIPAVLITADDVSQGKPDPEGYRSAARLLGLDPRRTIVLEDADSGIAAARAAEVGAVVAIGRRENVPAVDARVDDLTRIAWQASGLVVAGRRTPSG